MISNPCRIGFLGSDEIAIPFLSHLAEKKEFSLEAVLTQPDRPAGRGRKLRPNPIKAWAVKNGCPVRDPEKPGPTEVIWFKKLEIEILLVMAYGHILKTDLLTVAPKGCFNLHASLLPAYRGASPIETALALGETETGITLMRVVPRMDGGPIIDFERVKVPVSATGPDLRIILAEACIPLIDRCLPLLKDENVDEIEQDESQATYCRKLRKIDGALDFSLSAEELSRRVRAFRSWPGSFFEHSGNRIRVGDAIPYPQRSLEVGEISKTENGMLIIGTGTCALQINLLQKPGGKMLSSTDFLRGYKMANGIILDFSPSISLLRASD